MITALVLSQDLLDEIIRHLRNALPFEGCGLLSVEGGGSDTGIGSLFYPGTNIDRSPTRYTMDPAEVLAAFKSMREKGTVLGAIVHSHPGSPPTPSPTDLAEAYYPEALLVIVSFASGEPVVRVWQLDAQEPAEIALNIDSRA